MKRLFQKLTRRKKKKQTNVYTKPPSGPSAFEELPVEVKRHIASFLSVRDLSKLSETSKCIHQDLDIVVVSSPLTDRASQNKKFQTEDTAQCFAAILPNQEESHSHLTTFAFEVVTSPFFMGIIWVVEQDLGCDVGSLMGFSLSPYVLKSLPLGGGKSVAKTMVVSSGKVNLTFFPKTGKFYQFWVKTEGFDDNDHLHLNNMMLHQVGLAAKPSRHTAFQFEVLVHRRTMGSYGLVR